MTLSVWAEASSHCHCHLEMVDEACVPVMHKTISFRLFLIALDSAWKASECDIWLCGDRTSPRSEA